MLVIQGDTLLSRTIPEVVWMVVRKHHAPTDSRKLRGVWACTCKDFSRLQIGEHLNALEQRNRKGPPGPEDGLSAHEST